MSGVPVRDLVEQLLEDPEQGLSHAMDVLAPFSGSEVNSSLNFVEWTLPGRVLVPGTLGNVCVRVKQWVPGLRYGNQRTATVLLEISFETFAGDSAAIEAAVSVAATALAQCIDGLRAYSDSVSGTVIDVADPMQFLFGQFDGATSSGFICTVTISERATLS